MTSRIISGGKSGNVPIKKQDIKIQKKEKSDI